MTDMEEHAQEPSLSPLERKHEAMLQRLAANQDARLRLSAMRRAESAEETSPMESVQHFLELFSRSRERIEQDLASLRQKSSFAISEEEKSSLNRNLDDLLIDLSKTENLVAEKSYFLPAYEVRASQSAVAKLREDILSAKSDLLPKKKFSFKVKAAKPSGSNDMNEEEREAPMPSTKNGKHKKEEAALLERSNLQTTEGLRNVHSTVIVREFKDDDDDAEFTLLNMSNCKVFLRGRLRALFIHQLKNCDVYSGPITGSVLIEDVEHCTFMLASHQVRIHSAKSTDFYLRLRSRPIIEYSSQVRFAPYVFHYDGIQDDLRAANLFEETGLWANVDDFGWLKAIPSPNWSILPEDQRLAFIESINDK